MSASRPRSRIVDVEVRREPQHLAARTAAKQSAAARPGTTAARIASGSRTPSRCGPRWSAASGAVRARRVLGECRGESASVAAMPVDPPRAELLQCRDGHRHQLEVGALADVEPAGAGLVLVAVVDQAGEVLRPLAGDPVLLDRLAVAVLVGDVEVAHPDWPQQPLVADRDHEVGPQLGRRRAASRRSTGCRR